MTKITNIQWCHTTGNPTMGCPGCELYPTLGKIQNTIEKTVERYSDPTERITALIANECAPGPQQVKLHLPEIALRIGTAVGVADVGKFSRDLVSDVSQHFRCYAAEIHRRFNATGNNPGYARVFEEPRMHPGRMAKIAQMPPPTAAESEAKPWLSGMRRMIFVSDMGDALAPTIPFEFLRQEIVDVAASPTGQRQIWLWLTKQPHRMAEFSDWLIANGGTWPDNLVALTSVTSPASLSRVGHLRRVACKYRGLSVEPLWAAVAIPFEGIDWVIVGGESGHAAKPFHIEWARAIRNDAAKAGASFFLKQLGAKPFMGGAPLALADGHGGDWSEWSDDLRVRQVPAQWRADYVAAPTVAAGPAEVLAEVTAMIDQAVAGTPWTDDDVNGVVYPFALQFLTSGRFESLPLWAQAVVSCRVAEMALDRDMAIGIAKSSQGYPRLVLDIVELAASKKLVLRDDRVYYRRNNALRAEAYSVWLALGGCAKPTSQPASLALAEKYSVSKGALGAIFAHFRMGHLPVAA